MVKTVGVCGYGSTGSSAVIDLLHEFDETQVLEPEFKLVHQLYGLEDLEYHFKKYGSLEALKQFVMFIVNSGFSPRIKAFSNESALDNSLDDFLNKIISSPQRYTYKNYTNKTSVSILKSIVRIICKYYPSIKTLSAYKKTREKFRAKIEVMPEEFDRATKEFVLDVLKAMGIDYNCEEKETIVLNQPFRAKDPVRSFKFYENPCAIIVDRDPRDIYLFAKFFLYKRNVRFIPCHNVDDFIEYFCKCRKSPSGLREQKDIMFLNFEELVYDCENTTKKVADFLGIKKHIRKGEIFKPSNSRNNSQLFKKYTGYKSDIKKIETELSEYIFPFENYPDIEPTGGMFYGSETIKLTKSADQYIMN